MRILLLHSLYIRLTPDYFMGLCIVVWRAWGAFPPPPDFREVNVPYMETTHLYTISGPAGRSKKNLVGPDIYLHVYYAPINVSPHPPTRVRVGNFCCLEWQTYPRVRDIESL